MNAYELADDAKNISNAIEALEFVQKAVPMLRQQADRIAELGKCIEDCYIVQKKQADRIAELEELLKIDGDEIKILQFLLKEKQSKQIGVYDGKDLHIYTPQTKPLSDEEIKTIWMKRPANCAENVLRFARAIEERHGIK